MRFRRKQSQSGPKALSRSVCFPSRCSKTNKRTHLFLFLGELRARGGEELAVLNCGALQLVLQRQRGLGLVRKLESGDLEFARELAFPPRPLVLRALQQRDTVRKRPCGGCSIGELLLQLELLWLLLWLRLWRRTGLLTARGGGRSGGCELCAQHLDLKLDFAQARAQSLELPRCMRMRLNAVSLL